MDKHQLAIIIGQGPGHGPEGEGPSDSVEAAKDVLAAIKRGDAELLDRALRDHYEACEAEGHDEPDDGASASKDDGLEYGSED